MNGGELRVDATKKIIVVNGKDKTDSIVSYQFHGSKCDIIYNSSSRVYSYNSNNIRILSLKQIINPGEVIFKYKGKVITDITKIHNKQIASTNKTPAYNLQYQNICKQNILSHNNSKQTTNTHRT